MSYHGQHLLNFSSKIFNLNMLEIEQLSFDEIIIETCKISFSAQIEYGLRPNSSKKND